MANWKASSAVGVYYNDFNGINGFKADDLWGAYASLNFGKWNALANYEKINNDVTNDPEVWIGKLTYGSAASDARGSWDAWVEYINSDKGALLGGATNSWRDDSVLDNVNGASASTTPWPRTSSSRQPRPLALRPNTAMPLTLTNSPT